MHPRALEKSDESLRSALRAIEDMERAQGFEEFTDRWTNFLNSWARIYSFLEKGAQRSAISKQWLGELNSERKKDPLLSYLFQARHDHEHGLSKLLEETSADLLFKVPPIHTEGDEIELFRHAVTGEYRARTKSGLELELHQQAPPGPSLQVVHSRDGKAYGPPIGFRGGDVDMTPLGVARVACSYLEEKLQAARQLEPSD